MEIIHKEQIGDCTLYLGDCREVLPTLSRETIDMLWTDPPYGHANHDGDFNARLNEHRGLDNKPIENDDSDSMREVVDAMLSLAVPLLKPDCCCCCCCCGGGPKPTFAWIAQRMDSKGLSFFHSVIWDKINPGLGWRYRRQHEMIMVSHREKGSLSWNEDIPPPPNIIRISKPRDDFHPNIKPLELVERFIKQHTELGATVCDPFMGSGTTLVACTKLGRKGIGIEIEPKYFDIACKRIEQAYAQPDFFIECPPAPKQEAML